jgi:hypothetical protein
VRIIAFFDENVLPVDAAIIDMVTGVITQGRWAGHIYDFPDPESLKDPQGLLR